jgi:hypothetical protein
LRLTQCGTRNLRGSEKIQERRTIRLDGKRINLSVTGPITTCGSSATASASACLPQTSVRNTRALEPPSVALYKRGDSTNIAPS